LKQVVPKLIEQYSWTAKAEEMEKLGEEVVGDVAQEGMNLYDKVEKERGFVSGGSAGKQTPQSDPSVKINGTKQNPNPKIVDPDSGDPALLQGGLIFSYANTMHSLVGEPEQDPDWAKLRNPTETTGLDVTVDLIRQARDGFTAGSGNASKKLTEIFTKLLTVSILFLRSHNHVALTNDTR
jgi:hypothetical protein